MNCPSCGRANPGDAVFCGACGAPVAVPDTGESTCPGCSREVSADLNFCPGCGRGLHVAPHAAGRLNGAPAYFAAGRYRVKRFLGEGGRKRVYLAHDTRLNRDVAVALIKTEGLDEGGLSRLRREAQAMGALGDHPHIVTIHDTGEADCQPYIVSQYMEGGSVADLLAQHEGRRLPLADSLRIADQVCQALAYAHGRKVIHRDLKPANVWLTADGTAKLGDFGLAVAIDRSRLTMEGMMVGTVAYMPPEQATGRVADQRSDLYSLGAMLYEMLCGSPPFTGSDAVSIISQHINTPPVVPSWHNPQVPQVTESLVLHLLAKAPEERPPSAAVVRERLQISATASPEQAPATPATTPGIARLAAGPFIGRKQELATLKAAVESALGGHGSVVMIAGEEGIGKSRLADEAGVYARLRGAQLLVGRCYEGDGAPPFWPWVQILRACIQDRDPQALLAQMGTGAADIGQVVPELRERLPGLAAAPALEPEQARFRLFDSVTTFLRNAAHVQPTVLVLDDLQWADTASLLLLQFLVRELRGSRLLVMGTYHDVGQDRSRPLAEMLAVLRRERPYERIHLGGLSMAEVTDLLEAAAQEPLVAYGRRLARRLHRETEGNPFFIQEILRHLMETGLVYRSGGRWGWDEAAIAEMGIAEGVREMIRRRCSRLSDECNRVLTIASVTGREFEVDVLPQVSNLAEDQLLEALEEAAGAGVVSEVRGCAGRYSFSHALIRKTLYDELPTLRRVRLHRRVGEVIEALHAADLAPHVAELSYHFLEAGRRGDLDKAIDYARQAGGRAAAQLAYEDAVAHYRRALEALDDRGGADAKHRCELLLALGDVQWRSGDTRQGREVFARAAEVAGTIGAPDLIARAALGYGMGLGGFGSVDRADQVLTGYLEEALAALGEEDSILRVRVMARLAVELYYTSLRDVRAALSEQAVAMAERIGDREVQLVALYSRHKAMLGPDGVVERLEAAAEMIRLAAETGDAGMEFLVHHFRVGMLLELGEIGAADAEIAACDRLATALRQPQYLWQTRVLQAMRAFFDGSFERGRELSEEAFSIGRDVQGGIAMFHFGTQMFNYHWGTGRLAELEDATSVFCEKYPTSAWRAVLAFLYSELGKFEEARAEVDILARDNFQGILRDGNWLGALAFTTWTCVPLRDAARAAELYEILLPFADRTVVPGAGAACVGSVAFLLGELAAIMDRHQDAADHFEAALRSDSRMGNRPFVVFERLEYARLLLSRNADGDREQAITLLNQVLDEARDLGMVAMVERALAMKLEAQGVAVGDLSTSLYAVAVAAERERPDLRRHAAADGTMTILFSDIEGFTGTTERLGDARAHEVLRAHRSIVREQVGAHEGFEVKSEGDGFMLAFSSARNGLECAIAIQRAMAAYNEQHPEVPLMVRMGIHTGEAIAERDDFFGRTVILASRIASRAAGGEILVSSVLRDLTESTGEAPFDDGCDLELKGLSGTHRVHAVGWKQRSVSVDGAGEGAPGWMRIESGSRPLSGG